MWREVMISRCPDYQEEYSAVRGTNNQEPRTKNLGVSCWLRAWRQQ